MASEIKDFTSVLRNRRSVRRFKDKKVPFDLIYRIIEDATYAPTNCNQQLWKFVVITDQSIKTRLVNEAYSNTNIVRTPVVIVITYDGWNYKEAMQGASLATQNILLSATNLNLGSYPVNSYGNDKTIKKILDIPKNYIINCFVLIGYAEEIYEITPHVNRRPYKEVIGINSFNSFFPAERSYNPDKWTKELLIDYQKYYCRKTFLGKEMDIMDDAEKQLIKNALSNIDKKDKIIDMFSYDGCYLNLFNKNNITSVNLETETQLYVKNAVNDSFNNNNNIINYTIFDNIKDKYDTGTIIYKIERLPKKLRIETYKILNKSLVHDGELIIITRISSILFNLYYYFIIFLFGDDVRNTGLYAFWGPYRPMSKSKLIKELDKYGFTAIKADKYYFIPPFFNQLLQMFLQYIGSGGTSYLHRKKHINIFTKILKYLTQYTNLKPSIFGSVLVLRLKNRS